MESWELRDFVKNFDKDDKIFNEYLETLDLRVPMAPRPRTDLKRFFKSVIASEAWASSAPMSRSPANDTLGGCGTPTAGLGFGGYAPGGGTVGLTEEYNGTGWTTGGAMNTPEAAMGSFGTQKKEGDFNE